MPVYDLPIEGQHPRQDAGFGPRKQDRFDRSVGAPFVKAATTGKGIAQIRAAALKRAAKWKGSPERNRAQPGNRKALQRTAGKTFAAPPERLWDQPIP